MQCSFHFVNGCHATLIPASGGKDKRGGQILEIPQIGVDSRLADRQKDADPARPELLHLFRSKA